LTAHEKAVVEVTVLVVQRWILAALRHRRFFCLAELNAAIWELLPALNARLMRRLGVSRRELWSEGDISRIWRRPPRPWAPSP